MIGVEKVDVNPNLKIIFSKKTYEFIQMHIQLSQHATGFAAKLEQNFDFQKLQAAQTAKEEVINSYIDATLACVMGKHGLITESIINSLNRCDFLSFALLVRSNFELIASFRYIMKKKIRPFAIKSSQAGTYNNKELYSEVVEPLHRFLLGGRFDWESWFQNEMNPWARLSEKYENHHKNKSKNKSSTPWSEGMVQPTQTNIKTQVEDWAKEKPLFGAYYDVLCDLVHPNLGSNLLHAEINGHALNFRNRQRANTLGCRIVEQVMPVHMAVSKQLSIDVEHLIFMKMA